MTEMEAFKGGTIAIPTSIKKENSQKYQIGSIIIKYQLETKKLVNTKIKLDKNYYQSNYSKKW